MESKPASSSRLISLDVFRGLTIAGMVLVNNPGTSPVYWPLDHAEWNGLTPTDWIFPFFLFIVGVSIAISLGKYTGVGKTGGNPSYGVPAAASATGVRAGSEGANNPRSI